MEHSLWFLSPTPTMSCDPLIDYKGNSPSKIFKKYFSKSSYILRTEFDLMMRVIPHCSFNHPPHTDITTVCHPVTDTLSTPPPFSHH